MIELPYDLHQDRITAAQAAELAGVSVAVIWQWTRRGHVEPVERDARGRPRYLGIDVLRAEAKTRRHARRFLQKPA